MPREIDYTGLVESVVTILKDALEDVDVNDEGESPTTDQCPAVRLFLRRCVRDPKYICAGAPEGRPDALRIEIEVQCWDFSAQGIKDANRMRERLLRRVVDTLRYPTNRRLAEEHVDWVEIGNIEFANPPGSSGFYAVATLMLLVDARA